MRGRELKSSETFAAFVPFPNFKSSDPILLLYIHSDFGVKVFYDEGVEEFLVADNFQLQIQSKRFDKING